MALRLDLEARADAATRVSGAVDPDSGGFLASVVPALVAQPLPELALAVSIREPVAEAVRGAQEHGTLYRVVATWTP